MIQCALSASYRTWTCDLQLRRLLLYPTELRILRITNLCLFGFNDTIKIWFSSFVLLIIPPNPKAYNANLFANEFLFAFGSSTFGNGLYCFLNKRRFFDKVFNDFLVRSFLHFGYEVSFKALDKGAIEISGPYGISYTFRKLAKQISQL